MIHEERKRLSRQCEAIVGRLKAGDATNHELASISLKYTSRLSDCRKAGWDVRVVEQDRKSGRSVYRLFGRVRDGQMSLLGAS